MDDESDLPLATTTARSRRVLDVGDRGFARVARVKQEPPMDPDLADEFEIIPEDDESQGRIEATILRAWLQQAASMICPSSYSAL